MELAALGLEDRLLARLANVILELGLREVVHLLDPRRMDAAVLDQLLERRPGHLAPEAVEGREDDGLRRVVDDEVDAGEVLERADVAALAADDPALHVVRGQLDDGHGRLGGVARRHPLERVGDQRAARGGATPSAPPPPAGGRSAPARGGSGPRSARAGGVFASATVSPATRSSSPSASSFAVFSSSWSCLTCISRSFRPCSRRSTSVCFRSTSCSAAVTCSSTPGGRGPPVLHLALDLAAQLDRQLARLDLRLAPDRLRLPLGDVHARAAAQHQQRRRHGRRRPRVRSAP